MKQTHDEIIANWLPRHAKLKAAFANRDKDVFYRAKAFRLYFTLTMQIAIVIGHKKDEVLKSFPRGGISYGHPNWEDTEGGEYVITANKFPWPLKTD